MKKICQIIWEKEPFQTLVIFSLVCDKVHIFYPIILKLAQIVCINIDINPIENEENLSNSFVKTDLKF